MPVDIDAACCRTVFPGLPVYLCTWHVTKAWVKQIRSKVKTGAQFQRAFTGLHKIMTMPAAGDRAATLRALNEKLDAYEAEFAEHPALLEYVRGYWRPKLGACAYLQGSLSTSAIGLGVQHVRCAPQVLAFAPHSS